MMVDDEGQSNFKSVVAEGDLMYAEFITAGNLEAVNGYRRGGTNISSQFQLLF